MRFRQESAIPGLRLPPGERGWRGPRGGGEWEVARKGETGPPLGCSAPRSLLPPSSVQLEAEGSPRLPSALLGRLFLSLPPSPQAPSLTLPRLFLSSATSVSPSNPALAKPLVLSSSVSGSGSGSVSSLVHSLHLPPSPPASPYLSPPLHLCLPSPSSPHLCRLSQPSVPCALSPRSCSLGPAPSGSFSRRPSLLPP